nr:hypothetical protein [Halovivax limisalsi]
MKPAEGSGGGVGETSCNRECYRCDRTVAPTSLFTIEVVPPDTLSEKYADSVRYCCEHCAAGMNLSDFSRQWAATSRQTGEP